MYTKKILYNGRGGVIPGWGGRVIYIPKYYLYFKIILQIEEMLQNSSTFPGFHYSLYIFGIRADLFSSMATSFQISSA